MTEAPTTIRDSLSLAGDNGPALNQNPGGQPPNLRPSSFITKNPAAPVTVSEVLKDLERQKTQIQAMLDHLISDAITLRGQI
jgi:hypothetical protein